MCSFFSTIFPHQKVDVEEKACRSFFLFSGSSSDDVSKNESNTPILVDEEEWDKVACWALPAAG